MNIFLDIETIPAQKQGVFDAILADVRANFKAPSNLTKESMAKDLGITDANEIKFTSAAAMREKWETQMRETKATEVAKENYRKTALNGAYGEIFCICYAIDEGEIQTAHGDTEAETLRQFFNGVSGSLKPHLPPRFVGHNIVDFDLRFIFQRAVINQIKPPFRLTENKFSENIFDTMTAWSGFNGRIALKDLCEILSIPTPKGDIDGSQVWDCVKNGETQRVLDYCAKDVAATRSLYQKLHFQAD